MPNNDKIERLHSLAQTDSGYAQLVSQISNLWNDARTQAISAVNTSLLAASWHTGEYIVEFEQKGKLKAEYGKQLLTNLSKDLTVRLGKGYSRSNLFNMRLFYTRFQKIQTVSGICQQDDNPPIGIVLGAKKDELLMEYALAGIDNNLFAARYQLYLPNKAELQEQLNQLMAK